MRFPKVLGQRRADAMLSALLKTGNIPSALLFHGLEGTGKGLMAREFAKALVGSSCDSHPDITLINAQYQANLREEDLVKQRTLRVDTIRHARRDMELRSLLGGWKVAVIEEAHTLEEEGANALLKTLEEPQAGALWILVTSHRDLLPRTIPSRCFSVPFAPLSPAVAAKLLAERGLPEHLAEVCEGSMSRAIELAGLGPIDSDKLPRDLAAARVKTEQALFALAQELRLKHLRGELSFARVERPLRELRWLRSALRSNVDPRAILTVASLETENA